MFSKFKLILNPLSQNTRGLVLFLLILNMSCTYEIQINMTKIKMPQYRSTHNYKHHPRDLEKINPKSETVPGEARTIRQLLEDYTTGIPLPLSQEEFYNPNVNWETDTTLRNPDLDLTDIENIVDRQIETETAKQEQRNDSKESDDHDAKVPTDKESSVADAPEKEEQTKE